MNKSIDYYLEKGFDLDTAAYYASGRKRVMTVEPHEDFTLSLGFDNGETRLLDCKPFLKANTVFEPFMKFENFKRVYLDEMHCVSWDIDPNVNSNIVWNNKVDISPDRCYIDSAPIRSTYN